jgi:hypothetical protein
MILLLQAIPISACRKAEILGMFPDVVLCAVAGRCGDDIFQFVQNLLCDVSRLCVVLMTDSMDVETGQHRLRSSALE